MSIEFPTDDNLWGNETVENEDFTDSSQNFTNNNFTNSDLIERCGSMTDDYINTWQNFQWWCEGTLFTGIGLGGLIANCFSIGILCTKDMRKHSFNQLLIALCIFDLLFIVVSIPVYSFNLFGIFMENQVFHYLYVRILYPMSPVSLCASVYMTVALTIERWLAVCKPITYRNMNQTMSTPRRVAMYVTPVVMLSIVLNIPKFLETQIHETENGTEIDLAHHAAHDTTYRLYITIGQIFHPTMTTGLVPMGILIYMNLDIFKGIRRTHTMRDQRARQNQNQTNHQSAAGNLQTQPRAHVNQNQNQQNQNRTSETGLAIALMGIVVMHIVCHSLRVFLAGLAVYFIKDTLVCMTEGVGYAPPLWTMCAESISSLLIMINFSGNFLIYCSIMPPFKKAMSTVCTFLCFWKSTTCCVAASPLERRANSPDQTETLLPTTTLNGGSAITVSTRIESTTAAAGSGSAHTAASKASEASSLASAASASNHTNGSGRQVLVISHRELVPGEPPKTARVLRLLSKRRRTAGSHKRGNQVRPPPESIEATPYSADTYTMLPLPLQNGLHLEKTSKEENGNCTSESNRVSILTNSTECSEPIQMIEVRPNGSASEPNIRSLPTCDSSRQTNQQTTKISFEPILAVEVIPNGSAEPNVWSLPTCDSSSRQTNGFEPQIKQANNKQTAEISDQIQNLLRQTQTMPETNGCGKPHVVPRPSAMKKSAIKPYAIENSAKSDMMQVQVTIENQNVDRQQNTEDIMI